MHADEVDIDGPLVRRLIAAQFPHWADLPLERVESAGTDNAMFRLGAEMAVRLPRKPDAAGTVELEQRWLPVLAPHLPYAVPVPLGKGGPGEGYPWSWSLYHWLGGENPVVGHLAAPDLLAADLARFITDLRRVASTGAPASRRGVPLATRDAPTRLAIGELRGLIDTEAVTAAWDAALLVPERTGPALWSHSDLSPGNLLMTGGRLSAVIDFGCAGVGDPTVDLIAAWNLLPAGARGVFREAVGADEATWARARGWALSISLIQLPYYRTTNPVLAANSRHVIREVLADHANAA
ncbi:phosphotransferase [Streptomyces sp. 150FB]|uniref:aminoglycoside phosphotransferase family protein n=1 Tax=Streptomyces sp. 150FB TaxID=1576605 RepID=UPI0005894506|nr:aminoglycoside phosphotransferase family protein [Streptomyces sp. 150FB]KIF78171.1 phosphotransferase [Streptomyces sp. 150FB]